MKIRKSFVTNSSSSSFVIAVKEENGELTKDIEKQLLEWAKKEIFKIGTTKISTIEELDTYFIDRYGYREDTIEKILQREDDTIKNEYNSLKKNIEDGFVVYEKYISCEGQDEHLDMYEDALNLLKESKDFIGIETDLGY